MSRTTVAIIGAGPYGLAAAAHLRGKGVETHVLGRPMEFWSHQMPVRMLLRSQWEACSISDPDGQLTIDAYEAEQGIELERPVPLEDFVRYGRWFQQRVVPDLDERRVRQIERSDGGFTLELEDGEEIATRRVVIATGLDRCAHRPPEFDALPASLASHSSELHELDRFEGRRVAVVGGGQSAIELAALLHESGAEVEVIARADGVRWLKRQWVHSHSRLLEALLYPWTDVGPPGLNRIVALPVMFRRFPKAVRDPIARRCIRPAAAAWLPARLKEVEITLGRSVRMAYASGQEVQLELDDGSSRRVDHVVLATGYRQELDRHALLSPGLIESLRRVDKSPRLTTGFQTSAPGLHFVGAFAAASFGPLMRFVSGTRYTGRALAAYIARAERSKRALPKAEGSPRRRVAAGVRQRP